MIYLKSTFLFLLTFSLFAPSLFAQYPDLNSDISWSGGKSTVAELEAAFNNARTQENSQLNTSLPDITLPSQVEWDAISPEERALWLYNIERKDRGIPELEGLDSRVSTVAENFAQYCADNDTSGHWADGIGPDSRLNSDPDIQSCSSYWNENMGYVWSTSQILNSVAANIYYFMYTDASSNWGHRQNILYDSFNDNSGEQGKEGLLGVGHVNAINWTGGITGTPYPNATIAVYNIIDPCASWSFEGVGILENSTIKGVSFYPNPTSDRIAINGTYDNYKIRDFSGKVLLFGLGKTEIDVSGLANGIYILQMDYHCQHLLIQR